VGRKGETAEFRRIARWTLSLIRISAPSRRLRITATKPAKMPAPPTIVKRYLSLEVLDAPMSPAAAPRAGQQWSGRQQKRQVKAVSYQYRCDGDDRVQPESQREPNRGPTRSPDRTSQ
jgi:hypothetical protein